MSMFADKFTFKSHVVAFGVCCVSLVGLTLFGKHKKAAQDAQLEKSAPDLQRLLVLNQNFSDKLKALREDFRNGNTNEADPRILKELRDINGKIAAVVANVSVTNSGKWVLPEKSGK